MDGQLVSQKSSNENYPMIFEYNTDGQPIGFLYRNVHYYYLKNQMGDVIGITDANGSPIAYYDYDEWGNLLAIVTATEGNTQQMNVAMANPLRYRGYYYDTETGYYYLQSRYYDPSICRFINADESEYIGFDNKLMKWNLFVYCENDPIVLSDPTGHWVLSVGIEGQAAAILGVYAAVAFYPGNKKVSSLKGWGVSVGASFSAGLHLSGGAGVDIGFDGSLGGNVNVGLGVGASIALVPYTQVRIGGTAILASGNLLTIFNKWKVGAKKYIRR